MKAYGSGFPNTLTSPLDNLALNVSPLSLTTCKPWTFVSAGYYFVFSFKNLKCMIKALNLESFTFIIFLFGWFNTDYPSALCFIFFLLLNFVVVLIVLQIIKTSFSSSFLTSVIFYLYDTRSMLNKQFKQAILPREQ